MEAKDVEWVRDGRFVTTNVHLPHKWLFQAVNDEIAQFLVGVLNANHKQALESGALD